MFLLLSVCGSNAALLILIMSHRSFGPTRFCPCVSGRPVARKSSAHVNTFSFDLRGKFDPGSEFRASRHTEQLGGNGGREHRNSEWAKEPLQKCLNAYSELPTTHVNRSSHRLPLFPFSLSPSSISLSIFLLCVFPEDIWIQSETTDSGRRRRRGQDREVAGAWCWGWYEASVLCACRLCVCVCVCVCLSVHTYALTQPFVCPINEAVVVGWLGVVSLALPGRSALFSPAAAPALARLSAFCCSADGGAWRNVGESYDSEGPQCSIMSQDASECDLAQAEVFKMLSGVMGREAEKSQHIQTVTTHANTEMDWIRPRKCFQGTQKSDAPGCSSMPCVVPSPLTRSRVQ